MKKKEPLYKSHLRKDKTLAFILDGPCHTLEVYKNIPLRLMGSIMSQQLNTRVAKIIYTRFLELFDGKEPRPEQVLAIPDETLRSIGLSHSKVLYVKNVARFCMEHHITHKKLADMDNESILKLLTQIKGVGRWTVEMLLMFSLAREDVFSVDDFGLQQSIIQLYRIKIKDKKKLRKKILHLSDSWSPYRTYACLHLWQWKDS
ncbi:MAG: DNA-3-methyladenine glycosylase 2 family protein [Bacteroidetes bacterium]|nr:DNA-3-methyladenine glycosylase 2 family protein [Bacteroidota bacterium]